MPHTPRWRHYTIIAGPVVPEKRRQTDRFKPVGLWLSDDNADVTWPDYCAGNRQVYLGNRAHDVELHPDAKLLRIGTAGELAAFTKKFGHDLSPSRGLFRLPSLPSWRRGVSIDWSAVAKRHDGILITPHIGECRNHVDMQWYYTWDCASGCIWRPRAIKSIVEHTRPVEHYAPDDPPGPARYFR